MRNNLNNITIADDRGTLVFAGTPDGIRNTSLTWSEDASADDKKKFYANALQSINNVSGVILASLNCLLDPPEQDVATEAVEEDTAETE